MTKIVKYLPDLKLLKEELKQKPDNIKYYMGYEGMVGSSEAIDYVNKKIKNYNKKKNESKKNK